MEVRVRCKRVVYYDQLVEMAEDNFTLLHSKYRGCCVNDKNSPAAFKILNNLVDPLDVTHVDGEYLEVYIEKWK